MGPPDFQGHGTGLHWEALDEDISIEGLLAGRGDAATRRSIRNARRERAAESPTANPCSLDAAFVRGRLAELALTQRSFVEELGFELRTLQRWMAGTRIDTRDAERITHRLSRGTRATRRSTRAICFVVTFGLASISFEAFERPVLARVRSLVYPPAASAQST